MVGRESKLSFWYGNWSKKGPLRHLIQGPLNCEESKWEVKDLMTDMGWDLNQISFVLPLEVKLMIQGTPIPLIGRGSDSLAWRDNPRGVFDLRSAYSLVNGSAQGVTFSAKWIWKANTLPRIKTFMWQCAHNSLGVKGCLSRRGMDIDDTCPLCEEGDETVMHALRDCSWVSQIWRQLGVPFSNQDFWRLDVQDWLVHNGLWKPNGAVGTLPWKVVFPFALWNIWKSRNCFVFRGKNPNPNLAEEIVNQGMEFLYCAASPRDLTCSIIKRVRWEKPQVGWRKLNTDGASKGNPGLAGCGGVVRDENGRWIAGFSRRIGVTSSFEAELWGLREGLIFCSNLNIHSILVELDAKAVVDVVLNPNYHNRAVSPILEDCRLLLLQFQQVQLMHCFRQANRCADILARMSIEQDVDFISYNCPPVDIRSCLDEDAVGLFVNRGCIVPG